LHRPVELARVLSNFALARRGAGELAATPFWERGTQKA
jgi:hypothetical protein